MFWIKLLLPPENITRKETKLVLFCSLQLTSPKQPHIKIKQVWISTLCFIASIKSFKPNIWENIIQCWFYETSIEILHTLLTNPTFVNLRPKILMLICKTNIYCKFNILLCSIWKPWTLNHSNQIIYSSYLKIYLIPHSSMLLKSISTIEIFRYYLNFLWLCEV